MKTDMDLWWAQPGRTIRRKDGGAKHAVTARHKGGGGVYVEGHGFVAWHKLIEEWDVNCDPPSWAKSGQQVMAKTGAWRGVITEVLPNGVTVKADGDSFDWTFDCLVAECEPVGDPAPPFYHQWRVEAGANQGKSAMTETCMWCAAQPGQPCVDDASAEVKPGAQIEQTKGAVLHELRSSGPLGLTLDELDGRVGGPRAALIGLEADGCVRNTNGRWVLTQCQRALDEMADAYAAGCLVAVDRGVEVAAVRRERDEAQAAEEALRRGVEKVLADCAEDDPADIAKELQSILDDVSAEGVHLLDRLGEAEEKARLWDDLGVTKARLEELQEAEENGAMWVGKTMALKTQNETLLKELTFRRQADAARDACVAGAAEVIRGVYAEMVGARALSAIGAALVAHSEEPTPDAEQGHSTTSSLLRNALAAELMKYWTAIPHDAYATGMADATYIVARQVCRALPRKTVRVVLQDKTQFVAVLLDDLGPTAAHRYVLGHGMYGRFYADGDGRVVDSPARIHAEDLAAINEAT